MTELHSAPALRFKKLYEKTYTTDHSNFTLYLSNYAKQSPLMVMVRYRNTEGVDKYLRIDFYEDYSRGTRINPDGSVETDKITVIKIPSDLDRGYLAIALFPLADFGIAVINHVWKDTGGNWHGTASFTGTPLFSNPLEKLRILCYTSDDPSLPHYANLNPDIIIEVWGVG